MLRQILCIFDFFCCCYVLDSSGFSVEQQKDIKLAKWNCSQRRRCTQLALSDGGVRLMLSCFIAINNDIFLNTTQSIFWAMGMQRKSKSSAAFSMERHDAKLVIDIERPAASGYRIYYYIVCVDITWACAIGSGEIDAITLPLYHRAWTTLCSEQWTILTFTQINGVYGTRTIYTAIAIYCAPDIRVSGGTFVFTVL